MLTSSLPFQVMENHPEVVPGLSSSAHYSVAAIYAVLALPGFILNSVVLFTFFGDRSLLTSSNYFIVSITAADWLMATVANPIGAVTNISQVNGEANCKVYAWITTLLGLSTMLHHSAIAIDKCRTLWHPLKTNSSALRVVADIGLLWCCALLWSLFPLLGWSAYVPEGANTVCSIRWYSQSSVTNTSYVTCLFILFFFAPLLVIISSYSIAYWNVRRMVKQAKLRWGANTAATLATIRKSACLAKISVMMAAGFLVAWTPYAVVSLYSAVAGPEHIPAIVTIVPAMFAKSSCLYNPLINFFAYKTFRQSFWKRLQKVRSRNIVHIAWN